MLQLDHSLNIGKEKLEGFAEFLIRNLSEKKLISNMYQQKFACSKTK